MMSRPSPSTLRSGAERRRDRRYQVDLPGMACCTGADGEVACPVLVSDLSASGALIEADQAAWTFPVGAVITLLVEDFGQIEARVVHVGQGFYGLSFLYPHLHRDRLGEWLRQEVGTP